MNRERQQRQKEIDRNRASLKEMSLLNLARALQIQRELIYENTIDEGSCYWGPDGEAIRRVDLERLQSLENQIHPKIRGRK